MSESNGQNCQKSDPQVVFLAFSSTQCLITPEAHLCLEESESLLGVSHCWAKRMDSYLWKEGTTKDDHRFFLRWFRLQLLGYGYLNFCETISRVNWAVSSGPCPKMTASLFLGRFNHKVWMKWPQFVPCPYHPGITKARCGDSCSLTYVPSS